VREKYIDEKVGVYYIFGSSSPQPNLVDICDGARDIFLNVPKEAAEKIVAAQEKFRKELYTILENS
jgi:hypothetical protein